VWRKETTGRKKPKNVIKDIAKGFSSSSEQLSSDFLFSSYFLVSLGPLEVVLHAGGLHFNH